MECNNKPWYTPKDDVYPKLQTYIRKAPRTGMIFVSPKIRKRSRFITQPVHQACRPPSGGSFADRETPLSFSDVSFCDGNMSVDMFEAEPLLVIAR
ncbi:hypothetical protein H2248_012655 [Termitomyces sp. 'cryptogamus']|nr:hypothetical protein H2248_012655 [Termitomyces sp. 'cryptogamus']